MRVVDGQRHRDLLTAVAHHIQEDLDDLGRCEVLVHLRHQRRVDLTGLRDEGVGQAQCDLVGLDQVAGLVVVDLVEHGLVGPCVQGLHRAGRLTDPTVVTPGPPQAHHFGGHHVERIKSGDGHQQRIDVTLDGQTAGGRAPPLAAATTSTWAPGKSVSSAICVRWP